nr:G patch domain-containing protein 11 [Polyrhizophydium stewartii]
MNQRFGDRRVESDLHKARAACQTMDERAGVAMHAFWPAHVVAHAKEAEAAAAAAAEVAAAAADASSADDSYGQDEIPGATASEPGIHPFVVDVEGEKPEDGPAGDSGHESADADQVEPDFEDLEKAEQLRQVNAYLRERYFYCVWCGAVFADADEMAQECPGDTADDHEEL